MQIQRLRTLTTGLLHTEVDHVYEDLKMLTGIKFFTHMLPAALESIAPWLKEKVKDPKFWNGEYDPSHVGELNIEPMNKEELLQFKSRYK